MTGLERIGHDWTCFEGFDSSEQGQDWLGLEKTGLNWKGPQFLDNFDRIGDTNSQWINGRYNTTKKGFIEDWVQP